MAVDVRLRLALALVATLTGAACREPDGPTNPGGNVRVFVESDPPGARLILDARDTGLRTPDTLRNLGGRHDITAQLDTFGATYGFTARLQLDEADDPVSISGPLVNRCGDVLCFSRQYRRYTVDRIRFAANPVGSFFLERGSGGNGLHWPYPASNSYATGSMVGFAGILAGRDTVAIGVYDQHYLAGRPTPQLEASPQRVDLRQTTWIVPPPGAVQRPTVRGIQIDERIVVDQTIPDAVLLHFVFRNITNEPLYAALDPSVPPSGMTYDKVYIGFLLDADIGVANDDYLSYHPDINLVFGYDAAFEENGFGAGANRRPGLIGLTILDAPEGTDILLNGWTSQGMNSADWFAGQISERNGWLMLSGTRPYPPDHAHPRVGHLPLGPGDIRLALTAGPLLLPPGDSASIALAVVLADPAEGTFTSGTVLDPGNPVDPTRPLHSVAALLYQRAMEVGPQVRALGVFGPGATAARR